jgi:hypothetical protein
MVMSQANILGRELHRCAATRRSWFRSPWREVSELRDCSVDAGEVHGMGTVKA